ncbi:MAG: hypothetical protein VKS61_13020 [Candidatus Sericytochromatia bacterium]|nr:hypothetical protein [Candidatus Sericytochromatia bacterium]
MPDPKNKLARLLLGRILVAEGALSRTDLERAVAQQQSLREAGEVHPFGQVLLDMRLVTEAQIRHALALQRRLGGSDSEAHALALKLVVNGVIAPSLVVSKLDDAERRRVDLEHILTEEGLASEEVLRFVKAQPDALA